MAFSSAPFVRSVLDQPPPLPRPRSAAQEFEAHDAHRLFEASPFALVVTRLRDQLVIDANERAAELFGVPLAQARGQRAPDFWQDPADRDALLAEVARAGRVTSFVAPLRRADGAPFWGDVAAQVIACGGAAALLVGVRDITAQREAEERLRALATLDPLTGVANRRRFLELAEEELLRADRYGGAVSLAMIDADHFKRVNDRFGHAAGDAALVHIASTLAAGLRRSDAVARYGGEELALLLPATPGDKALATVDAMRACIAARPVPWGDAELRITVSAGVVERLPGEDVRAVLARADEALYRAKAGGRDRVCG